MQKHCFLVYRQIPLIGLFGFIASTIIAADPPSPLVTPHAQAGPREIRSVEISAAEIPVFSKLEWTVHLSATFSNPFDPEDIAVDARVQSPSGRTIAVPGFFYQPFTRALDQGQERLSPAGAPDWRVRFTPVETGEYNAVIVLRDRSGESRSEPLRFTVTPSDAPGFIRISTRDPRYFAFDNGRPFFPIGANTCWASGRGTLNYDDWFPRYAEAGCNFGRLWLSPHWSTFALERTGRAEHGRGMGQFDLANAWRIDYVLELARAGGLHLKLCIDSYNILREKDGYPQWENTPHNAVHGGPLRKPSDFWTNPVMEKLYRAKLRYLVARYGYSPSVMAWEFWNEADITTGYQSGPSRDWHERMARYLRALDPYDHLITTSFAGTPGDRLVDTLPGIDFVQTHHYNSPDLAVTLAAAQAQKAAYGKPHIVGEIGADSGGPRAKDDHEGLQIHDPIWVSIATGGAGAAQPWWWDNYIHPKNLYSLFNAAVRFTQEIDWPGENFQPLQPRIEWRIPPEVPARRDLVLQGGPRTWTVNEFNEPRRVRVTRSGAEGQLPVAGVQHGLGGHRDKHNPVTFEIDLPWPVRFEVEVGDVSGHGGARLELMLNGELALEKDFPDPDGFESTQTLKQYAGNYGIEIPAGQHLLVLKNTGRDWFMAEYRFRNALERSGPPILAWGIAGTNTAIAWARVEERTWRNICERKIKVPPAPASLLVLPGIGAGDWVAEIWETWGGRVIQKVPVSVDASGEARVPLPLMEKDYAIKLLRQPEAPPRQKKRASSAATQFILVNRAPGLAWNASRPESFQPAHFEEIRSALPDMPGAQVRPGVAFIFSYLATARDEVLVESLKRFLQLATETGTPVLVQLDGENWWGARPDLWNWWDPEQPGYNPENRENVEWSGWSPEHALKIAWRNWGRQIRVLPPPNLMSPRYREACREKMDLLVPLVLDWWRSLPPEKEELFVGIKLGWESSIGVNAWYYPNGNALLERPASEDPAWGLKPEELPARGVAQIGYAALKTSGIRHEGEITEADLAEIVRRHLEMLSRQAAQLGVPREKLFTHIGGWKENERLYQAAVNEFSSPGWSFYRHAADPREDSGVQSALQHSDAPAWAAVEWLYQGPPEPDAWRNALESTLSDPRCRFLCIFNWEGIRKNPAALTAIRQVVEKSVR
jgi:hypothetical protein